MLLRTTLSIFAASLLLAAPQPSYAESQPLPEAAAANPAEDARADELRRYVRSGNTTGVRRMMREGVSPNLRMENGDTLFTYAMRSDAPKVAEILFEAEGFSVTERNQFGETPIMLAAIKGEEKLFDALLKRGASITETTDSGWTVLHYAAAEGRDALVRRLLDMGSQVNAQTKAGITPLHMAARLPSRPVVTTLLRAGAYRDYCTDQGLSPADFAKRAKDDELADYLKVERCAVVGTKKTVRIRVVEEESAFAPRN